jgi:hypothetical protein
MCVKYVVTFVRVSEHGTYGKSSLEVTESKGLGANDVRGLFEITQRSMPHLSYYVKVNFPSEVI